VRLIVTLPKVILGGLVLFAIGVMLYGVFMRYIMLPITDWLDVDPFNFFWVEEVGETTLAWLTLIGAAIAVRERSHFALAVLAHRLPSGGQAALHVAHNLLIAGFGGLMAWVGLGLVRLNMTLTSPALEINLGWLYGCLVGGGILMMLYALDTARRPHDRDHTFADVRE
jgi:TRAP-type C4-dicarboxylate transport system permease small subunit